MSNGRSIEVMNNGLEPNLGPVIKTVREFMSSIGCWKGLVELDVILSFYERGLVKDVPAETLLVPLDECLTSRFGMSWIVRYLNNNLWAQYIPKHGRDVKLPAPVIENTSFMNRLLGFMGSSVDFRYKGDPALVSILFLSYVGMIAYREKEKCKESLRPFDEYFPPFNHDSPNPILVDIRHAVMHNNVRIDESMICFENRHGGDEYVDFHMTVSTKTMQDIALRVAQKIHTLDFPDNVGLYLRRLVRDVEPVLSGQIGINNATYDMALRVTIINQYESRWPRTKEVIKRLTNGEKLLGWLNEHFLLDMSAESKTDASKDSRLEGDSETERNYYPDDIRDILAHEWWNPDIYQIGQRRINPDKYLMNLYVMTELTFGISYVYAICDAAHYSDKIKKNNPKFKWSDYRLCFELLSLTRKTAQEQGQESRFNLICQGIRPLVSRSPYALTSTTLDGSTHRILTGHHAACPIPKQFISVN